ncbi:MAG: hypothetical protein ACLU3I_08415 [Acutalibacteraceae bacterium]
MSKEKAMQKEQFLRETERQLRMAQVEAKLEADDLIHASWNGKPLCTVDANGTVRFSPDDIRGAGEDRLLPDGHADRCAGQRVFADHGACADAQGS